MDKYLEGVKKTGFSLEFSISEMLASEGWTVINNKYYIDDVQGSAREIDILAYKVSIKDEVQVYTVLIISCKKSEENTWALLSKDKDINDPNIDWSPITLWSNEKVLKLIIENYDWKENYVNSSGALKNKLFTPEKHIFAFQELNNKSGKPQNDKAIFNSIVSSMKSQNYEIGSLNKRKEEDAVYNFNLLSIVDAPLIRVAYSGEEVSAKSVDSDLYVSSYIVDKKETVSRVNFIKSDNFNSIISVYNDLHLYNQKQVSLIHESYFVDCLKDKKKRDLFIDKFSTKVSYEISKAVRCYVDDFSFGNIKIGLNWSENENSLEIYVDDIFNEDILCMLNEHDLVQAKITSTLKEIYQYEGSFYFDWEVPF